MAPAEPSSPSLAIPSSLAKYNIPASAFVQRKPHIQHILASAVVFHPLGSSPAPSSSSSSSAPTQASSLRVLLLRRHPDDYFPLFWETPGGSVDPTDGSLLAAAARELHEETGLVARSAVRVIGAPPERAGDYGVDLREGGKEVYEVEEEGEVWAFGKTGDRWGKVTFLLDIEGEAGEGPKGWEVLEDEEERSRRGGCVKVTVQEGEHVDWRWATEEEVRKGLFADGSGMEVVGAPVRLMILEAFKVKRRMMGLE